MSDHPALSETLVRVTSGTLSTDPAATIDLAALMPGKRVVGFEVKNTHASGALYWTGHGDTATSAKAPVLAAESSGFWPSNDGTISIIREAGVPVTYVIVVAGR